MVPLDAEPGFRSLGQGTARTIVQRATASERAGRTLLVHGPARAGKDAFIDDVLALLMCTDADPERRPCNACRGCRDARARAHADLVVASPETWRESKATGESIVAAARRWLLDAAGAPVVARRRVILIDRADRANEQTQNALLKALEEPTDRHIFILVADEPSRLLPTIRSRSQPVRIGPVPREDLAAWLVDHERLPADQADVLARLASGLTGAAVAYARSPERVAWRRRVQGELLGLLTATRAERFAAARELLEMTVREGAVPGEPAAERAADPGGETQRVATALQRRAALLLIETWSDLTRDLLLAAAGRADLAPTAELLPELGDSAARLDRSELAAFLRLLDEIHEGLEQNAAPRLALERAMLDWPRLDR
jgi:DNA polymerase-3 subunit delta'